MNILYLTISNINLKENGLYQDLIKELKNNGHNITLVMTNESRVLEKTILMKENGIDILKIKVGNQFGVNFIQKGINTLLLEKQMKKTIKKYLYDRNFDLILYATPPVTFAGVIEYCKHKYNCATYLMLKDIFPQNAVDIGLFKKNGIIYKVFKKKEQLLYEISDYIGCMSNKNIEYLINNGIKKSNIELFPNTIEPTILTESNSNVYRSRYNIDKDCTIFVFGGNLGRPQGIDFLLKAIKNLETYNKAHFFVIGNGTERSKVEKFSMKTSNITFIEELPKNEYENLIKECDVGLLSLDYRFTIPNYPSRTLSYMDKAMPIFACTDMNTDIKELIEKEAKCGKWCYSNDIVEFEKCIKYFCENKDKFEELGMNGRRYLENNFNVKKSIEILENHFCNKEV